MIKARHIAVMGYDNGSSFYDIKAGDLVIIARGANWQKECFFAGLAADEANFTIEIDNDDPKTARKLVGFVDLKGVEVPFTTECTGGESTNPHRACCRLHPENSADAKVIEKVLSIVLLKIKEESMRNWIDLILASHNVILTGAPGTGKTYTAQEVAKALILGAESVGKKLSAAQEKQLKSRLCTIQFHPGYDYSDFVIGMKPVLLNDKGKEVQEGERCSVSFKWKKGEFVRFAELAASDGDNKYVMVIDEINRADLSRVFGELFSRIEPDYRGEEHAIDLPNGEKFYVPSNLYIIGTMNDIDRSVDSMDFALRRRFAWKEVTAEESMRIIDAKVTDAELAERLKGVMCEINQYLGGNKKVSLDGRELALGLGPEYQLGGAIFANATKYGNEEAMSKVWQNHVRVILSEYLRGNKDKNGILKVFAKEFGVSED